MQSPPLEWTLDITHLVARNLLRNQGEPDFDTLSEVVRAGVKKLGRHGPMVLDLAIVGGAIALRQHWRKGLT